MTVEELKASYAAARRALEDVKCLVETVLDSFPAQENDYSEQGEGFNPATGCISNRGLAELNNSLTSIGLPPLKPASSIVTPKWTSDGDIDWKNLSLPCAAPTESDESQQDLMEQWASKNPPVVVEGEDEPLSNWGRRMNRGVRPNRIGLEFVKPLYMQMGGKRGEE